MSKNRIGFGSDLVLKNNYVGIGTTNPSSKLDVIGGARIVGTVTATSFVGDGSQLTGITASASGYADAAGIATDATYAVSSGISTVATSLQTSRTFEITGDIIASPISFDGSGNVSLAATIQPNSVGLGSDTTGDYVQSISGTSNQITVTGGTGEGSTPTISIPTNPILPGNVTVANDLQVNNNLNVTGNITIGGTSAYIISNDFRVKDADIVLGYTTSITGAEASNDTTANHGGIAVASTEGTPLVQLYNVAIGETNPATYKKIMWFKSGAFAGLNTDAWLINYAVGIGSTQIPNGVRLAAGGMQVTDSTISSPQLNVSGVTTTGLLNVGVGGTTRVAITIAGNVGIGTTNPSQKVDIITGVGDGTANETNAIRVRHSSTSGNAMTLQMGVNNVGGGSGGGSNGQGYGYLQSVYWGGGNNTIALNPKGGGVAVGSNWAGSALDVRGDLLLKTTGTNTQLSKVGFNGAATYSNFPTFIGAFADNGVWSNGMALTFNTIRSGDVSSSTGLERMRISSDGNILINTTTSTGTTSQPLQVTGGTYVSGNLGIGATNPTSKLTVSGNSSLTGITTFYYDPYGFIEVNPTDGNGNTAVIRQGTNSPRNGGNLKIRVDSSIQGGDFIVATGGDNERLRVLSTGNVGIGTTTPTSKLDVVGDGKFTGVVTATSFSGNATSSNYATSSGIATYASTSGISTYATNAGFSTVSGISTYATSSGIATYASTSGISTYATSSGISTYATSSGIATYATTSGISTYATSSGIATYATTSGISTYAISSGISTYATSSGISTYATSSGISTYATSSGIATYATTSGISTYATSSGISTYATNAGFSTVSGISTYATSSGISTYTSNAGFSTVSGISTYTSNAGFSTVSGISTYATSSGISTYTSNAGFSTSSGVSTSVSGGVASVLQLNVSGFSTITSGLAVAGSGSTTTTLNVTGVSTHVGVSTFNNQVGVNGGLTVAGSGVTATTLNVTGVSTITSGLTVSGTGATSTTLRVTGVSTVGFLTASNIYSAGIVTASGFIGSGISLTGIVTSIVAGTNVTISGSTGQVTINASSVGGGSSLTVYDGFPNLIGVVTSIDFGSNLTVTSLSAGIATVNASGGGGGSSGVQIFDDNTDVGFAGTIKFGYGLSASTVVSGISTVDFILNSIGYASTSGISTYATNAGFSTVSGISTYAINAGYSTSSGISTVATTLQNARDFSITGNFITASAISFNGSGNVALAATITPDSIGLGTYTTGDYVRSVSGTTNQITVTGGTGEGSTPTLSIPNQFTVPQDIEVTRDLQVNRNLNVNGNITIGGTAATLFAAELKIFDADLVLGFRTDGSGNDVSNDNTANHGGIAVASTEGNPLVQIYNPGIGETNPATYKKIMWFKTGSFTGLGTDAWLSNYAVGIGSTQFPTGTRLAAGSVQFTENDLAVVRNINSSGIVTAINFIGNLSGFSSTSGISTYATNAGFSTVSGISTYASSSGISTYATNAGFSTVSGISTYATSSGISTYASSSGISTYATSSGISTYASSSGISTYATSSGISTYTTNAGFSTVSGISTYATSSGISTYASSSGISTYTSNAGFSTSSGVSTSVSGGVASVLQLNVSGFSTITSGLTVAGSGVTSTTLRVSGVSTHVGVSTFNDQVGVNGGLTVAGSGVTATTLNVVGVSTLGFVTASNIYSAGIVTASGFIGSGISLTGIVTSIVAGTNITVSGSTGQVTINASGSGSPSLTLYDGFPNLIGVVTSIDFGSNLTVTSLSAGIATVNASGGGGGSSQWVTTDVGIHTLSNVGIGTTNPIYKLTVSNNATSTPALPNAIADFTSNVAGYSQINIRNTSNNANASSDIIVTADTGTDTVNYIDLGINNSNYSSGSWTINGPLDGYLYSVDTNLSIGVAGATKYLSLFAGGTLANNEIVRVNSTGVGIGTTNPTSLLTVKSQSVNDFVGLFSGATNADLVRITQDGVGNALRVDDQAGGTTPFIIDNSGKVGINTITATSNLTVHGNATLTGITTSTHLDGNPIATLRGSILAMTYNMSMP